MKLLALETVDFRNLAYNLIEPHPRFNVLSGDNGQGKTNVLEAIYLLGTLRSFRASRTEEMIGFGAQSARVRGRVVKLEVERLLEVELHPGRKQAKVDGKGTRANRYFGGVNVVLFAPDDLRLPRGAPANRRRFLDRVIWNAHPAYLDEAQTYDRLLRSRNALLRDGSAARRPDLLDVYDLQLAAAAVPLCMRRQAMLEALLPWVVRAFSRISGGLSLSLRYHSRLLEAGGAVEESMLSMLRAERARDLGRGATSSGPHIDDLVIELEGRSAGAYASQGQLRAMVLALKIAEIEWLAGALGDPPVLLLDDVSSELDPGRNAQLFEFLSQLSCQAFITTTHPGHVLLDKERKDFQVVNGHLSG